GKPPERKKTRRYSTNGRSSMNSASAAAFGRRIPIGPPPLMKYLPSASGVSGKSHLPLSGSAGSGSSAEGDAIIITAASGQMHNGSRLHHSRLGSSSKGHDRAETSAASSPPSSASSLPASSLPASPHCRGRRPPPTPPP